MVLPLLRKSSVTLLVNDYRGAGDQKMSKDKT